MLGDLVLGDLALGDFFLERGADVDGFGEGWDVGRGFDLAVLVGRVMNTVLGIQRKTKEVEFRFSQRAQLTN